MDRGQKILNEENPFMREIWAMGYDRVYENKIDDTMTLVKGQFTKTISISDVMLRHWKIITAILYDGRRHQWLSEADGSAERFRELIRD